jgi:hypothetical protein
VFFCFFACTCSIEGSFFLFFFFDDLEGERKRRYKEYLGFFQLINLIIIFPSCTHSFFSFLSSSMSNSNYHSWWGECTSIMFGTSLVVVMITRSRAQKEREKKKLLASTKDKRKRKNKAKKKKQSCKRLSRLHFSHPPSSTNSSSKEEKEIPIFPQDSFLPMTLAACTAFIFCVHPGAGWNLRTVRTSSRE